MVEEPIRKYFSEMAKKRHAKMTKTEKSSFGRMMALKRWEKYRETNDKQRDLLNDR